MSQTSLNSTGVASTGALSLQSNGTTEAIGISTGQVATLAQNPVLTSGTANGVGYLNGSKVLTTGSALTFDGTNLGIGTSSPSRKLTVLGTSGSSVAQISDGVNGTWRFSFSASPALQSITDGGDNKIIAYDNDANNLRFYTLGSEVMRLTSTGLGVGTSSPSAKLDVAGTTASIQIKTTTTTGSSYFQSSSTGGNFYLGIDNSVGSTFGGGAYFRNIYSDGAYPLLFWTNGTERMRLDSAGNLGLGVTPNASAIIDAQSTTKGVRFPNMTSTQKNAISSPPAGLVVFDTTLAKLCVYSGSAWQTITSI